MSLLNTILDDAAAATTAKPTAPVFDAGVIDQLTTERPVISYGAHEVEARTIAAGDDSPEAMARARAVLARGKLREFIAKNTANTRRVVERVMTEVPRDAVLRLPALLWDVDAKGNVEASTPGGEIRHTLHRHALGQVSTRLGVPLRYLGELLGSSDAWARGLARTVIGEHAQHTDDRVLVRMVGDEIRGVLSDKYRRIDCRPMLEAAVDAGQRAGLVLADGMATDIRVSVRMLYNDVIDLPTGDSITIGFQFGNSDYGAGAQTLSAFLMRTACLNGAMLTRALRTVHVGGRIADTSLASERTLELDTATQVSLIRDTVARLTGPEARAALVDQVRASIEAKVVGDPIKGGLTTALSKSEQAKARDLFKSPDVEMLPPGDNRWRLSNVFSWMANEQREAGDIERALDLQALAGEILDSAKSRDVVKVEATATAAA